LAGDGKNPANRLAKVSRAAEPTAIPLTPAEAGCNVASTSQTYSSAQEPMTAIPTVIIREKNDSMRSSAVYDPRFRQPAQRIPETFSDGIDHCH